MQIYTDYVYPFEIAAVILLVAIIAAIALTHRERRKEVPESGRTGAVQRKDRLRMLRMPAEKRDQ